MYILFKSTSSTLPISEAEFINKIMGAIAKKTSSSGDEYIDFAVFELEPFSYTY